MSSDNSDRWDAGIAAMEARDYPKAVALLRDAIAKAPSGYLMLPDFHGTLANALDLNDQTAEAREHFEEAIRLAESQDGASSSSAAIARGFYAEHFLRCHQPAQALAVLRPVLGRSRVDATLRLTEALALRDLCRESEAAEALRLALAASRSDDQRERIETRFRGSQAT